MSSGAGTPDGYPRRMNADATPPEPAAEPRVVTVVNIDDQKEIRDGLAVLIDATKDFTCVGRFRSMEDALANIGPTGPDLALVDIGLPGMSGIEGIRLLKARYPAIVPLVLTVYGDDARIFAALCAGACGYLLKKTPPARLIEGLREAVDGGSPMSPEVARRVISLFRDIRPPEDAAYDLTPHETRLLRMLVEGHNYKTAAKAFGVTTHAVSFHMRRIYEKLQVHSKSEAVAKALRNRLV
jgi:DNA-binding NarL/FixJ family response regulator